MDCFLQLEDQKCLDSVLLLGSPLRNVRIGLNLFLISNDIFTRLISEVWLFQKVRE